MPAWCLQIALGLLLSMVFLRMLAGRYAPVLWLVLLDSSVTALRSLFLELPVAFNAFFGSIFAGSLLFMLLRLGLLAVGVGAAVTYTLVFLP